MKQKKEIRKPLYEKYDGRCAYCGDLMKFEDMTVDHIIPLAKGGQWEWENYHPCCIECNAYKADKTVEEMRNEIEEQLLGIRPEQKTFHFAQRLMAEEATSVVFYFEGRATHED